MTFGLGAYLRRNPTPNHGNDWFEGESPDHFFFIPVIYWAGIYFLLGIAYVAYKLSIGSSR